jgi:hypothetical protein
MFFWRTAPTLDVVGLGEFRGISTELAPSGEALFSVRYLSPMLARTIPIDELRRDPVIRDASFLKSGPSGTVFPVSMAQGERIYAHVCRWNPLASDIWPDIDEGFQAVRPNDIDLLDVAGREGGRKLVQHLRIERDRRLVEAKKRSVLGLRGRLTCEVCGFDFKETYGEIGEHFCEVHHRCSLSSARKERVTAFRDLAIVCSNCHRMLHRDKRIRSIQSLQKLINFTG